LTTIYFVRHAHSIYTRDELNRPLSEQGFKDANQVTNLLKHEQIDVVISSPYKRAIQTVEGTATIHQKSILLEEGFKERVLSSEPVEDFPKAIKTVWENWDFAWPGGESNEIAQKRGVSTTLNVLDQYEGKNIVIGTHGNIMVLIMNYFTPAFDFHFWQHLDMPDIYQLTFEGKALIDTKRRWMSE